MKNPLEEPDYVPVSTKLDNLADDIRRASIMMKNWEKNGYDSKTSAEVIEILKSKTNRINDIKKKIFIRHNINFS